MPNPDRRRNRKKTAKRSSKTPQSPKPPRKKKTKGTPPPKGRSNASRKQTGKSRKPPKSQRCVAKKKPSPARTANGAVDSRNASSKAKRKSGKTTTRAHPPTALIRALEKWDLNNLYFHAVGNYFDGGALYIFGDALQEHRLAEVPISAALYVYFELLTDAAQLLPPAGPSVPSGYISTNQLVAQVSARTGPPDETVAKTIFRLRTYLNRRVAPLIETALRISVEERLGHQLIHSQRNLGYRLTVHHKNVSYRRLPALKRELETE